MGSIPPYGYKRSDITKIDYFYRCSRYREHGAFACTPHRITLDLITAIVLEDIKNNARLACEDEEEFIQRLHKISMKEKSDEMTGCKKKEALIKNRLTEIKSLAQKAFEKNANGLLPDEIFGDLMQDYNKEKTGLADDLAEIQSKLLVTTSQTADISKKIGNLKQYVEITELSRAVVTSLIDFIYISEPVKTGKEKVYDIDIHYRFQNPFRSSLDAKKEDTLSSNKVSSHL